ncbi:hypothetical protein B0O80DRAFT_434033 [Mortierella sp. GBAus27b]|nr:hypothetical protein B0O80DRAFT_434033 [Mortierella sp. GBAus27b]
MLFKSSFIAAAAACITLLSVATTTEAHVGLKIPCVRDSNNKECGLKYYNIDYNTAAPIGVYTQKFKDTKDGLCKHKPASYNKRTTYSAGQSIDTKYDVDAAHGGGHCQWALSYDKGKTWVVFQTILKKCLVTKKKNHETETIKVTIPKDAPAGDAIFMWMWNNKEGNRELYTGCADVKIKSSSKNRKFTGLEPFVANFGQSNSDKSAKNNKYHYLPENNDIDSKTQLKKFDDRKKITITAPRAQ